MVRHCSFFWASVSTTVMVLLAVSFAAAAQDPFQEAEKSAAGSSAKDPFQAPEKSASDSVDKSSDKKATKKDEPEFVQKTDREWQRILPRSVYMVTRLKATEPAFTGRYATGHFRGTFLCACCNAELFSAQHKFDSGTGWPSFWRPLTDKAIDRAIDNSEAEQRIEVMCHRCGAHLGHVFDDGPAPTGLRFCINSLSLKLKPPDVDAARSASTKAKAKVKTTKTKSKNASPSSGTKGTAKTADSDSQETGDEKPAGTTTSSGKSGGN